MCEGTDTKLASPTVLKLAAIPFRFKAGGGMAPMAEQHHHRSTTKVYHKPFKSKHATKGAIKDLAKGAFLVR